MMVQAEIRPSALVRFHTWYPFLWQMKCAWRWGRRTPVCIPEKFHTVTGPAESWHLHAIVLKFTQPNCWHLIVSAIEQLLSPRSNFEGSAEEPVCLYDGFTCGTHRSVCLLKHKTKMLEIITSTWMLGVWAYSVLTRKSGSESPSDLSLTKISTCEGFLIYIICWWMSRSSRLLHLVHQCCCFRFTTVKTTQRTSSERSPDPRCWDWPWSPPPTISGWNFIVTLKTLGKGLNWSTQVSEHSCELINYLSACLCDRLHQHW